MTLGLVTWCLNESTRAKLLPIALCFVSELYFTVLVQWSITIKRAPYPNDPYHLLPIKCHQHRTYFVGKRSEYNWQNWRYSLYLHFEERATLRTEPNSGLHSVNNWENVSLRWCTTSYSMAHRKSVRLKKWNIKSKQSSTTKFKESWSLLNMVIKGLIYQLVN